MFKNLLSKKHSVVGDPVNMKNPELLFYNDPMSVLDTLYVIYSRLGKETCFLSIINDFINGKYGKFNATIQYNALIRAMILYRSSPFMVDELFKRLMVLIDKNRKNGVHLTSKTKNIINCEIAYHYLTYYCKKNLAIKAYTKVIENITDAMEVVGDNHNEIVTKINDNINGINYPPEHCFTIDDIINPSLSTMYEVLRVGFVLYLSDKGTTKWFQWGKRGRFKELYVVAVELYRQLKHPLCGSENVVDAINECILTYTSDPPLIKNGHYNIKVIEEKYNVTFDKETYKYKWYIY